MNLQEWMKKCGSQVGELNQLKLKTDVFHDDRDGEMHMTQLVGFVTIDMVLVNG